MKLRTEKGEWILTDNGREINFENDYNSAWLYVFFMKGIRDLPTIPQTAYPVRSLIPKMKKRKLVSKLSRKANKNNGTRAK